ncbi:MAG: hypothetical protein HYZ28_13470 [Myxococcales bacterium]|nr:hypothetical protein [Myxococcales bacterium]
MATTPFPFSPPPAGDRLPRISTYTPAQVAEVLRWTIERYTGKTSIPPQTAFGRWYATMAAPPQDPPSGPRAPPPPNAAQLQRVGLYDFREAVKLAWSIAVLHASRHEATIASSVIEDLLEADNSATDLPMPSGTGTLYQAARLLQSAGGSIKIFGRETKGRDMLWMPVGGGHASIERKDRAFFQTFDGSKADRFFKDKLIEASEGLPDDGSARIVSIGYSTTVREAAELQATFKERLLRFVRGSPPKVWPDAAYGAFVGYEVRDGVEEAVDKGIFVPIIRDGFRQRPEFLVVQPAFKRAYAVRSG